MATKIFEREALKRHLASLRQVGGVVVFTNGCFDLLHAGHVRYLKAARDQGDLLVVGLNADASVRRIKGAKRPIVSQEQRAEVLAALACVDFVVLFEEPDPLHLIQALQPDILIKGADWAESEIVGAEQVKAAGGRVVRVPLVPAISTTQLIDRIVARFGTATDRPQNSNGK